MTYPEPAPDVSRLRASRGRTGKAFHHVTERSPVGNDRLLTGAINFLACWVSCRKRSKIGALASYHFDRRSCHVPLLVGKGGIGFFKQPHVLLDIVAPLCQALWIPLAAFGTKKVTAVDLDCACQTRSGGIRQRGATDREGPDRSSSRCPPAETPERRQWSEAHYGAQGPPQAPGCCRMYCGGNENRTNRLLHHCCESALQSALVLH
jgi:hypothetical protein